MHAVRIARPPRQFPAVTNETLHSLTSGLWPPTPVMDDSLYFSEQHLATREMVSQFARDEVAPVAAKFDAEAKFPWDNIRKMGELGLLGAPWPEELGGA